MKPNILKAKAYKHHKTKELVKYIPPHSMAILAHEDIDITAAESLIFRKVKAVINVKQSMTGEYDHNGVSCLLEAGIPVFDVVKNDIDLFSHDTWDLLIENDELYVYQAQQWLKAAKVVPYSFQCVFELKKKALGNYSKRFTEFARNSLRYAEKEAQVFAQGIPDLRAVSNCKGKNVLIVTRGEKYEKDIQAVLSWIRKTKPVIIAVDGGADGLMKHKIHPNIILGDMDSVTDKALNSGATLIAHRYVNGKSPGQERLDALGLKANAISFPGTSEDVAILLPFWAGAHKLYVIGSHTSMVDFLDKGRFGMGSSLLTRMQTGHRLIDLRGIHHMSQEENLSFESWRLALIPAAISAGIFLLFEERVNIAINVLVYSILGGG